MRRPGPADVAQLCCLGAIWGGTFPAVKIAVTYLPTATMVAMRIVVGALAMAAIAALLGRRPAADRRTWAMYAVIAFVGNVLPFLLIAHGQRQIDAGLGAILMATMPLVTIVLAHAFTGDEKLSLRGVAGVLVGLCGILVLVGIDALKGLGADVLAQLSVTAGAMCYALHTVLVRRLTVSSPATHSACVLAVSAAMAVPLALATDGPPPAIPMDAVLAILFLGILANGAAYMLYFHIIGTVGAAFTAMTNYIVPVAGVIWAALILGERPSLRALLALGLILSGIAVAHLRLGARKA